MSETFNPSFCTVEVANVTNVDGRTESLSALIYGFNIVQSLNSSTLQGTIRIYDSVGLLHNFPLRAEEKLDLQILGHDLQTNISIKGQIIKIDNVSKNPGGDGYFYTLHFITRTAFEAGKGNVITAFRNKTGSYAAQKIFKKYYNQNKELEPASQGGELPKGSAKYAITFDKGRRFYVEESKGQLRAVIPDYTPAQAMNFLASKSLANADSPSNMFRFFETYEGFHWVTDDWLLKRGKFNKNKIKELYYLNYSEQDPKYADLISKTITSFENSSHVDTGMDIESGAYRNVVMEVDFTNHTRKYYHFDYQDNKNKFVGMSGTPKVSNAGATHSDKFITDTFTEENAKQFVVFRDWQDEEMQSIDGQVPRTPQKMVEIIQNRVAYTHHLNNAKVAISMQGRIDLQPGDIVDVITQDPTIELPTEQNQRLSGRYLVSLVNHSMEENILSTTAEVIKYDWQKGDV